MKKHFRLMKVLTVVFASFLCLLAVGLDVTTKYATMVNDVLGITSDQLQKVTGGGDVDTNYFPAEYVGKITADPKKEPDKYKEQFAKYSAELSAYCDEVSREVEGEGLVLLKNDNNALPLKANAQVSCFTLASKSPNYSASGSGAAAADGYADFQTALEANNFGVNGSLMNFYGSFPSSSYGKERKSGIYYVREVPWEKYTQDIKDSFSVYGDAAIVVLARSSGESTVDLSVANVNDLSEPKIAKATAKTATIWQPRLKKMRY